MSAGKSARVAMTEKVQRKIEREGNDDNDGN